MRWNICQNCNNEKLDRDNRVRKYCSLKCRYQGQKGKIPWNKGKTTPSEVRIKQSKKRLGVSPWNKGITGYKLREGSGIKISAALQKIDIKDWTGHKTPFIHALRMSSEYTNWRKEVFKRDGYRCLDCGQLGGKLNADHIFPFSFFPRLRFEINNGRTLCEDCHRKTPTFGNKAKSYERITKIQSN